MISLLQSLHIAERKPSPHSMLLFGDFLLKEQVGKQNEQPRIADIKYHS